MPCFAHSRKVIWGSVGESSKIGGLARPNSSINLQVKTRGQEQVKFGGYHIAVSAWRLMIALIFVAAVLLLASLSRPMETLFRDLMMSTISPFVDPGDSVVIVTITEEALEGLPYRSPIDRGFLADVVEQIGKSGPRAIGIDILFDSPTEPAKDERLANILQSATTPVVIADAGLVDGLSERQETYLRKFAPSVQRGLTVLSRDAEDGVVRAFFPGREVNGAWHHALARAIAVAGGLRPRTEGGDLAYFRTAKWTPYSFPTYPAQSIRLVPNDWLSGKFVLIGSDLPLEDHHLTPFAALDGVQVGSLPGVVIHAHALAQSLQGVGTARLTPLTLAIALLAGAVTVTWLAWQPLPVILKPLILIVVISTLVIAATLLFSRYGLVVPIVWPTVLLSGLFAGVAIIAWQRDNNERRYIRRAFAQYVSPAIVDGLVKNPNLLRLGGERRTITCIFTDLAGFTALCESQPPERAADLLNEYLNRICDLFVLNGATIDKIIGDSVVGFLGAPATQDDQAERAVALALDIDRVAEELRAKMASDGMELGVTRVGIHMGPAVVGNIGGNRFFDYTAVGDTVNTASRLEGANRNLGTRLCISAVVANAAPSHLCRPAAIVFLKGKSRSAEVYEPIAAGSSEAAYFKEYCSAYQLMMTQNASAAKTFGELAARHPDDNLVALHARRLQSGSVGAAIQLLEK